MKNKLLFRKAVTQLFFSLCLMLCCANSSWGQQVIGSYPVMDGGFEAQTVGTLPATVTGTVFSTWTYGTLAIRVQGLQVLERVVNMLL